MNKTNQYQQNIDIIKNFFKKPIVLASGIFTLLSAVLFPLLTILPQTPVMTTGFTEGYFDFVRYAFTHNNIISGISGIGSYLFSVVAFDILALLTGLALIILHFSSKDPEKEIGFSVGLLRTLGLISFIVSLLFTGLSIMTLVTSLIIKLTSIGVLIFSTICFFIIADSFFFMRYYKSVKNNISSIFLNSSGAKPYVIFCFVKTFLSAITLVFIVLVFLGTLVLFDGTDFPWLITNGTLAVVIIIGNLLTSITAFSYCKYIKGIMSGKIQVSPPDAEIIQQQTSVVPESVNSQSTPQENSNLSPLEDASLIAEFPEVYTTPSLTTCSACGNKLKPTDTFCDLCGKKVM